MQTPKISIVLCVFVLGVTFLSNAADNPDQAAARAALAAKLAELGADMPTTNAVESAPAPKLEQPAPVVPQVSEPAPTPPKVEEPVMVPVNGSAEARAKAKADKAAAALKAKKDAEIAAADAKAKKDAEKKMAAQQKAEQKLAAEKAAANLKAKKKAEKIAADAAKKNKSDQPTSVSIPAPILAPPSAIPATKEMRLDALLQKYKTDQITPQQYQEQRAVILAEP